MSLLSRG